MIRYLISEPFYNYKSFKDANFVCYRNKNAVNFEEEAKAFIKKAKNEGIENIFLNTDYLLASKLKVTGVHLTSKQQNFISSAKKLGLKVIISCHNEEEIKKVIEEKVDFITYSPIFETPNKGKPKGIKNLEQIVCKYDVKIIALGGIITKEQIEKIKHTKAAGFASIRYFLDEE